MASSKHVFEKWVPIDHLGKSYDVDGISWGAEGLSFTLAADGREIPQGVLQRFQMIWDPSHIISYHVTDETYRADCWKLDFENGGRFYTSRESEYIENLRQKSPLFPEGVIHFVMVGTNTIIDVLAKEYPTVKVTE